MRRFPYFKPEADDNGLVPPPLSAFATRKVRFEEVDPLGVVWHGRYASYFEDARLALFETMGMGYQAVYDLGFVTPIKQFYADYALPLLFNETYTVTAFMHWTRAARINIAYRITDGSGKVRTTGYTVQLFLDRGSSQPDFSLAQPDFCMTQPEFFMELSERWRQGRLPR